MWGNKSITSNIRLKSLDDHKYLDWPDATMKHENNSSPIKI